MTDASDRHADTTTGDGPGPADGRGAVELLRNPGVMAVLALVVAAIIFSSGKAIGEAFYLAFEGDTTAAVAFGLTLVAVVVAMIGAGVWFDRRQRVRRQRRDG